MNSTGRDLRVILIGGSSHSGKSTLAQSLASKLGWSYRSTDKLARHPGRPWCSPEKALPDHVVEHYATLSPDDLIVDVLRHYEINVLPQVRTMVKYHASDPLSEPLVLEGSALWPEFVMKMETGPAVAAVWLAADPELFRQRIYRESNYDDASEAAQQLIRKFIDRTLLYNKLMRKIVYRRGLLRIEVGSNMTAHDLTTKCIDLLQV